MRKILLLVISMFLLCSTPAFALFTNGGFETGDFTGWTVTPGSHYGNGVLSWGSYPSYNPPTNVVISGPTTEPYSTPGTPGGVRPGATISPYVGNYMARINDGYGMYHATKLSQSDTLTQADIDAGSKLYVDWGVVLDDPSHDAANQPFFSINVFRNNSAIYTFSANASAHSVPFSGWLDAGLNTSTYDTNWYKLDVASFDLTTFIAGDLVGIELIVADCGYGGHGGYAFLDGIGTTYQPPNVAEPVSMLLIGSGLAGLVGFRKRFARK